MTAIAIIFWTAALPSAALAVGYGVLLAGLVKPREASCVPRRSTPAPAEAPEVTLLIAAYNEQEIVAEKMGQLPDAGLPRRTASISLWVTHRFDRLQVRPACWRNILASGMGAPRRSPRRQDCSPEPCVGAHPHPDRHLHRDANTMLNPEAVTEIALLQRPERCVQCRCAENAVAAGGYPAPRQPKEPTGNTNRNSKIGITALPGQ